MARCCNCSQDYARKRMDQAYCSTRCSKEADNRELRRGRALYRALYWWRKDRKNSRLDLLFVCRSIAEWRREDMEHQRPAPPRHDHSADRGMLRPPKGPGERALVGLLGGDAI